MSLYYGNFSVGEYGRGGEGWVCMSLYYGNFSVGECEMGSMSFNYGHISVEGG